MTDRPRKKKRTQPIDRVVTVVSMSLVVIIGVTLWIGDRTAPVVLAFSWQNQQITAQDQAFFITFNRPMDRESVETNLRIQPNLSGKFSWSGRRMAFTLTSPAIYGTTYNLNLTNAFDRFHQELGDRLPIQPFTAQFHTPQPILAFVNAQGQLTFLHLSAQKLETVTPPQLKVTDYRFSPDRATIYFFATGQQEKLLQQKLYRLDRANQTLTVMADDPKYQNFKFDLAPNGQVLVLQRLHLQNQGEYGLWVIREGGQITPLDNRPGGEFQIAPDSNSLALAQGEGIAILAIEPNSPPLDFLPKFGSLLSFAPSGRQALTIAFNKDFTRSLYLVANTGEQKELLKIKGSIISAHFAPQEKKVYCLLSRLVEGQKQYQEEPELWSIDLRTMTSQKIYQLPDRRNLTMQIAPDGQYLAISSIAGDASLPQLEILPLANATPSLTPMLKFIGDRPRWLP
jgi:hypothetical protein